MLPAIIAVLTWIPAILGLGALIPQRGDPAFRPGIAGFLGLGVAGAVGTTLNFWVAVGPLVAAMLWVTGVAVFVFRFKWLTEAFDYRDSVFLVILLVASSYLMRRPIFQYDTPFYHLQAVKWIAESSIFAGIANIHHRLGFNSLWWTTAAAVEHPMAVAKSAFFLNQLPILFIGQVAVVSLRRLVAGEKSFSNLLLAGACLPMASATFGIGGLYVDYTACVVAYLALALWVRAWEDPTQFAQEAEAATFLSVLSVLLKVTYSPLAAVALVNLALRRADLPRRWCLRVGLLSGVAAVPLFARGLLLSGCLVFPVWDTCFNGLPWTVPEAKTREVADGIRSWAQFSGPPMEQVPWLEVWPRAVFRGYPEAPLLLFSVAAGLALWLAQRRRPSTPVLAMVIMSSAGLITWFLAAPDPRFGLGFLWALGLTPTLAGLAASESLMNKKAVRVGIVAGLVALSGGLVFALDGHERTGTLVGRSVWRPPILDWPPLPFAPVRLKTTQTGLRINTTLSTSAVGELCVDAPIPCTPLSEFNPSLRFDGYFTVSQ